MLWQAGKLFAVSRHWLAPGGEVLQVSKAPDVTASETQKVKDMVNVIQSKYVTDEVDLQSLQPSSPGGHGKRTLVWEGFPCT